MLKKKYSITKKKINNFNINFLRLNIENKLFKKYDFFNYKNFNFLKLKSYEKLKFKNFKKKKNYFKNLLKFNTFIWKKSLNFKANLIYNFLMNSPKPVIKKIYYNLFPKIINNLTTLLTDQKIFKIKELLKIKKLLLKKKKNNKNKLIYKNYKYLLKNLNFKIINIQKKIKINKKKIKETINIIKNYKKWKFATYPLFLKFNMRYWDYKLHYLRLCWWFYNTMGKKSKFKFKKFKKFIKNDFLTPLMTILLNKKKKSILNKKKKLILSKKKKLILNKKKKLILSKKKKLILNKKKKILIFSKNFFSNNIELNFNIINIRLTCNNTSIVVTSSNGLIIFGLTTGILKFKGSKKNTFVATLTVAKKIYWTIIKKKMFNLKIVYKSSKRRAKLRHLLRLFSKSFKKKKIRILLFSNNTSLPYNGSIKKKKRR